MNRKLLILLLFIIGFIEILFSLKQAIFVFIIIIFYLISFSFLKNKKTLELEFIKAKKTTLFSIILSLISSCIYILATINSLSFKDSFVFLLSNFIFITSYVCSIPKFSKLDYNYHKYSKLNTIIFTGTITENFLIIIKKYHQIGINLILTNKESITPKLKKYFRQVDQTKIKNTLLDKNIHLINFDEKKLKNSLKNKNVIKCHSYNQLNKLYNKIVSSRVIVNQIINTLKTSFVLILPIILANIIMPIIGFPLPFNSNLLLILSVFNHLFFCYILPNFPFSSLLNFNFPKLFSNEEKIFIIIQAFNVFFALTVSYMSSLVSEVTYQISLSICIITYLYAILFIIFQNLSEKATILNVLTNLNNKIVLITFFLILVLPYLFSKISILNLEIPNINNYLRCIIIAFIFTIWFDLIKIAKFTKLRKKEKNENN